MGRDIGCHGLRAGAGEPAHLLWVSKDSPSMREKIGFLAFSVSSLIQQMCKNSETRSIGFRAWESCAMYVICTTLKNTSGGKPRKPKLKIMSIQKWMRMH